MALNDPNAALDPGIQSDYSDLTLLRDVAKTCVRCELAKTRTQVVFGDGPYLAAGEVGLMIMGEGPGEDEDAQGRPFVGRSGRLLESLLRQAELSRDSVWVSNTVKCRPLKIEGGVYKNRPPTIKEQKACEIWWHNELNLLQPKIVLCLGATAAKMVSGDKNFQITKDRGRWLPGPQNTELFVTFHPAYILRLLEPQLGEVKATVIEDLQTVRARLEALRAGTAQLQEWQKPEEVDQGQQMSMF